MEALSDKRKSCTGRLKKWGTLMPLSSKASKNKAASSKTPKLSRLQSRATLER